MTKQTMNLLEKIDEYEKRAKREHSRIPLFPYEHVDTYVLLSGSEEYIGRKPVAIYHGRFIDVLLTAFENPGFIASWCGPDPGNCNNGYVVKYEPPIINEIKPIPKLIEDIAAARALQARIGEYQTKLEQLAIGGK
jgi:hypothetical protein